MAHSDLLLIAESFFFESMHAQQDSLFASQTRKKSFIMSQWLEVSIGAEHVTHFITRAEMTFHLRSHGFISLRV